MKHYEITEAATEWFDKNYSIEEIDKEDYWVKLAGGYRAFYRELKHKCADPVVDACCTDIGIEEDSEFYEIDRSIVENTLAKLASYEMQFTSKS